MTNWSLLRTIWFQKTLKKSTSTSVRRLQSCFKEKHGKQINLDAISKQEAPQLLKHFFLEIRQTTKENKGKEYEPGTLQTYRNGLRRYFLERPCPPAVDNFDLEKSSAIEFEEVSTMLSMKKKDLKQKGLGNKPNAAQPVETEDIEKMWSSGAIGLQNPRSLLHLVWWNNVTHLMMIMMIINFINVSRPHSLGKSHTNLGTQLIDIKNM